MWKNRTQDACPVVTEKSYNLKLCSEGINDGHRFFEAQRVM
jgi:hypothetical protein